MQELEQIIRNVNAVREAVIECEKNPNSEIRALTASLALVEAFLLDVRRIANCAEVLVEIERSRR